LNVWTRFLRTGIGQGRVTDNLAPDLELLDGAVHIPDAESIAMVYRLLHEEGIYIGASSALNVVAAVKVAEKLGKGELGFRSHFLLSLVQFALASTDPVLFFHLTLSGKTVVTILCDGAYRCVFSSSLLLDAARVYQKLTTRPSTSPSRTGTKLVSSL